MPPLITSSWRRAAQMSAVAGALVAVVLGVVFFHGRSSAFDNRILLWLLAHVDESERRLLLNLTEPWLSAGLVVLVGLVSLVTRRWALLALAAVGPILATGITEGLGKPVIGRILGSFRAPDGTMVVFSGSYPSGHETGVASTAVLMLVAAGQFPWRAWARTLLAVVLTVWVVVAALILVRSFYHYTTDTIGALGLSIAVVLGSALTIDRLAPRFSSPDARSLPRTSRAA